jgi:hypothetical protein
MSYEQQLSHFNHSVAIIQHFVLEAFPKFTELAFKRIFPQFVNYIAARMGALHELWLTDLCCDVPQQK